ncbi:LLM class flavin-dependent oxidoreductase [Aureimonas populi]|uniref:LLM class flavin-dependent oxidoreductase n=1 Tax=Aureimonas populi TaxID=1701758 RepID=A0ABW5CP87_9HYPH|nr:LLM class flavin-dependent oxidoreductase [Aureimonas populi]
MKFGLFNLMTHHDNPGGIPGVMADTRTMVEIADEVGFDAAWFAEHHFTNYSLSVSPLMMASYMAGRTKRIRLGPGVVVLPLHHPLRVAQEIALLDQQSGGRAVLGLGSGYQAHEFERFGIDLARKNEIFVEYWTVLRAALVEGRVEFRGRHITVPETAFAIRPVQKPMPDVFLTSIAPEIFAAVAPDGAVPFVSGALNGKPGLLARSHAAALQNWEACGFARDAMPVAMQQYIHVTDDKREAMDAAERGRSYARMAFALRARTPAMDGSRLEPVAMPDEASLESFRDNYMIGDPHGIAERIVADLRRFDPIHFNCFFQFGDMPIARARRSLERFAKEVVPLVEREIGPLEAVGRRGLPPAPPRLAAAG